MKFTLKNKTELINLNGYTPELIIPTHSELGYLDEKVNKILIELKNRKFDVEGIDIAFDLKGFGPNKKVIVEEVRGKDFRIILNENGFQKIIIPKMMLQKVNIFPHSENLLVILYYYVGKDWEKDKYNFFNDDIKNDSKKRGDKKTYLIYDTLYTGKKDILLNNNYCGNEYGLENEDPVSFDFKIIQTEFGDYLDFINDFLQFIPTSNFDINIFTQPVNIPLKNDFLKDFSIYTFITEDEYRRLHWISSNIINDDELINLQFGIIPQLRLVPKNVIIPITMDTIVYDGFIWAELFKNEPESPINTRDVYNSSYIPVRLNLHNYANVFVVDKYVESQKRKDIYSKYKNPNNRTKLEDDEIEYTLATTMVHINDYKGNYIEPVILIKRELHPDEISI